MNTTDAKRVLETALICAPQPLSVRELGTLFDMEVSADTLKTLLADLQLEWTGRGVELVQVATGWRYGEWLDFLADGIGVLIGATIWLLVGRLGTPQR